MIKKLLYIVVFCLFCTSAGAFDWLDSSCNDADVTTWCLASSVTTLTDTFCGGGANSCAGDIVYLEGGTRTADLDIQASGTTDNYVTITNYPSSARTVFSKQSSSPAIIFSNDASWVDLRGDGLSGNDWVPQCTDASCYGILVEQATLGNGGSTMMRVSDSSDSDNIKIRYLEIDGTNSNYVSTNGLQVQANTLTGTVTLNNYEIDHNYIHDTTYSAMYMGNNHPSSPTSCNGGTTTCPYVANFLIHDNLLVDLGAYGITYKGIGSANTSSKIYNNYVLPSDRSSGSSTGLTYEFPAGTQGIGVAFPYAQEVEVYKNWIEKTDGPGLKFINGDFDNVLVYNNVILGCGTGNDSVWRNGVYYDGSDGSTWIVDNIKVYNNTIVKPVGYGIASGGTVDGGTYYDNLIVVPTEDYISVDADFTNPGGNYADTESAVDPGFVIWSNDDNYSNDNFDLASGHIVDQTGDTNLADDYAGVSRPQGLISEDGAYENDFNTDEPDCGDGDDTTWCIQTEDSAVDGDTYCSNPHGTGTCDPGDTLYIQGGAREDIQFEDLVGTSGGHITIINDPVTRVEISDDAPAGRGVISFVDCYYVDLLGNNGTWDGTWYKECETDACYGIEVEKTGSGGLAGITILDNSDNIRIGYLKVDQAGAQTDDGWDTSIKVGIGDSSEDHDGIELDHNWFNRPQYKCTYVGENNADGETEPYIKNASVHDNLCLNSGAGGIMVKGLANGTAVSIYNNIVKNTGLNCDDTGYNCGLYGPTIGGTAAGGSATTIILQDESETATYNDAYNGYSCNLLSGPGSPATVTITDYVGATRTASVASWPSGSPDDTTTYTVHNTAAGYQYDRSMFRHGINCKTEVGYGVVRHIYNNYVEATPGPGIQIWETPGATYGNVLVDIGIGADTLTYPGFTDGVLVVGDPSPHDDPSYIYDNIILDVRGYGIFGYSETPLAYIYRNIIVEADDGEIGGVTTDFTEGSETEECSATWASGSGTSPTACANSYDVARVEEDYCLDANYQPTCSYPYLFNIGELDCDDGDDTTWCSANPGAGVTTTIDGDTFCDGTCDPGDIIYLEGGARGDIQIEDLVGTSGDHITITNDPDTRVEISDDAPAGRGVISFVDCYYVDLLGNNGTWSGTWYKGCETDACYGIEVEKTGSGGLAAIAIIEESDFIKIGYIATDQTSAQMDDSWDVSVKVGIADNSVDHTDLEFHHNWWNRPQYKCTYIGENNPDTASEPYTKNISVHDNLCTDTGAGGIMIKGGQYYADLGNKNYIYNNIIKRTGLNCGGEKYNCGLYGPAGCSGTAISGTSTTIVLQNESETSDIDNAYNGFEIDLLTGTGSPATATITDYDGGTHTVYVASWPNGTPNGTTTYWVRETDEDYQWDRSSFRHGINFSTDIGTDVVRYIYNNYVEDTFGPGIRTQEGIGAVYGNVIVNSGIGEDTLTYPGYTSGISLSGDTYPSTPGLQVYDNIIINSRGYGIYGHYISPVAWIYRNIIIEADDGEMGADGDGGGSEGMDDFTEGTTIDDCDATWASGSGTSPTDCANSYDDTKVEEDYCLTATWYTPPTCGYDYIGEAPIVTALRGAILSGAEYK